MALKRTNVDVVYRGNRVNIERHTFDAGDGRTTTKEVGRHVGAVCVLPLLDEGRVVLIRQKRAAVEEVLWELPAGTLEPPEPAIDCARRELVEEAGYEAGTIEPLSTFWTAPGLWDERMHAFVATNLTAVPVAPEVGEEIEPVVVPYAEAIAMIGRGEIVDGKTMTALLVYDRFRRR